MTIRREDLRIDIVSETGAWEGIRDVTDEDLAQLGYYKLESVADGQEWSKRLEERDGKLLFMDPGTGMVVEIPPSHLAQLGYVPKGSIGAMPWDELEGLLKEEGWVKMRRIDSE